MTRTRTPQTRTVRRSVRSAALAGACAALLLSPACAGVYGKRTDVESAAAKELAGSPAAPARPVTSVPDSGGVLSVRPYDGARAGDARLEPFLRELQRVAESAASVASTEAGLEFGPGRGPVAMVVDDDVPRGDVAIRVLDGVRRPVIRVPANGLLNGTFLPAAHFAPLVIEAAALSAAGDRSPPPWLVKGLAIELSGAFDRWMHERALGGEVLRVSESALFPKDVPDDPLTAATRVRALERIARGERPLARFVAARLAGDIEDEALDVVGVQGALFLDAAADTERAQALEDLALGGPLGALASAREALADGAPARAAAAGPVLRQALADGDADEFVASEVRIVLAQIALEQGDFVAAARHAQAATSPADALLRPAEARLLEARIAKAAGETAGAARVYRAFAADFPTHAAAPEALAAVGISAELAAAAPGAAADVASDDARVRARAAVALGESGDASAAPLLRELTRDRDDDVRRLSFAGLALVLGDRSVEDLERGTHDQAAAVRAATLSMLAFAAPARGAERAKELAADSDAAVRSAADRVLASAAPPRTTDAPKTTEPPGPKEPAAATAGRDESPPPPPSRTGTSTTAPPDVRVPTPPRPVQPRPAPPRRTADTPPPPRPPLPPKRDLPTPLPPPGGGGPPLPPPKQN